MAERNLLSSWQLVRNAHWWESMRADYWRRNDDPEKADDAQAMADNFRIELDLANQKIER
jgi:hypothetical protein|tara:strand:- start:303 stop:482 length:180 start_codon:yes stop_codon:yes gene_type:complete